MKLITKLAILMAYCSGPLMAGDEVGRLFVNPPDSARPQVFWYWIDGNVTREGVNADLEAMKRVGIGGVELYNIGGHGTPGGVKMMSPEWRELMRYAITRAGELGLEVDLNNSPGGWSSSGGPWITPEISMQKLTWSETRVQGGKSFAGMLNQPATNEGFYRDVAVLAFPTPEAERNPAPVPEITSSDPALKTGMLIDGSEAAHCTLAKPASGQTQFIQFVYTQPFLARSLRIYPRKYGTVPKGRVMVSDDGQQWREVKAFARTRGWSSLDIVFADTTARQWRIEFQENEPVDLSEVTLGPRYRIAEWTGKGIWDQYGLDKPSFTPAALSAPAECCIKFDSIADLSSEMDATGRLNWDPPAGDWTIMRFGHTATGQPTGPAGHGADGLECDKFDPAALDVHWANGMEPFLKDKELGPHIQYVHVDSYEKGAQNWTKNFPKEFRKMRGYDLLRYLPTVTGRVVENLETSERFLWDFRQVCCGLMAENYFGHMADLCHRAGKQFTLEPYHQVQFKSVTAGGKADVPMCEFWTGGLPGPYWYKLGASPAHVYGKNIVGAEAFTAPRSAGGDYSTDPWALKALGDIAFCGGVNRYVCHVYVMQPWLDKAPGMTLAAFGSHFERSNTWFEQMTGFTKYVSRCQNMLRQGKFVADVLYFGGENAPDDSMNPGGATAMPRGFDYDICDEQVVYERIKVKDGKLVLPDGMTYRILVLPDNEYMTPALLKQIRKLVKAGATVVGPKPVRSPSLKDQPAADEEVKKLAEEMWGRGVQSGGSQKSEVGGQKASAAVIDNQFGKGRVIWGRPMAEILKELGVGPDFEAKGPLNYIHRKPEDSDLYFVASSGDEAQVVNCAFRVSGKPELLDPLTGEVRALSEYRVENGMTVIPMRFEARQSWFVIFRGKVEEVHGSEVKRVQGSGKNFVELKPLQEVSGKWTVQFDPKWGGPKESVEFEKLTDWTTRPEDGIKYYSGKAIYRKVFDLAPEVSTQRSEVRKANSLSSDLRSPAYDLSPRLWLDLGVVKNIATVRFNGKDLGIVWCAPWHVDVTGLVKEKGNELEIDVVNLWPNRMIGDEQLPEDCEWQASGHGGKELKKFPAWLLENKPRASGRYTFSSWKHWTKDDKLLPSGLLGPVRVMTQSGE